MNDDAVNQLLATSRAEHDMKKRKAGLTDPEGRVKALPNYPQAEQHILKALTLRLEAHALDPEHTASGWADDKAPDAELIRFYVAYSKPLISAELMAQITARFPDYAEIAYIP